MDENPAKNPAKILPKAPRSTPHVAYVLQYLIATDLQ